MIIVFRKFITKTGKNNDFSFDKNIKLRLQTAVEFYIGILLKNSLHSIKHRLYEL